MTTHRTDFEFAFEGASSPHGPWGHLSVVEFRGSEEISALFRYELTLLAKPPAAEIDPHDLVRAPAALRIHTLSVPQYRIVHGIITEAEEIGHTAHGMLYRVVLMPPLARAKYRKRCRIFLEKTTRQIIDAVLGKDAQMQKVTTFAEADDGSPSYRPAQEKYAWRVSDASRIDDVAVHHYCVQYNESDLDFVARLLEAEGIAYHFENGLDTSLLVLSDRDEGRTRLDPFLPLGAIEGRDIETMRLGARLRPKAVKLDDYNWKKPALDMTAPANGSQGPDLSEYHYPGGYPDAPSQGKPLATALLERYGVEADYAVADGHARMVAAGSVFMFESNKARYEGEYLVTKLTCTGHQEGILQAIHAASDTGAAAAKKPYTMSIECARRGKGGAPAESRFRPARITPRPRIVGSQTGFVAAEPASASEIHVGGPEGAEVGCVRVRFHWDTDTERLAKEPASCWVRVNHPFAGIGEGGVWHPRVGVEVIVEYEDGDPDRPLVTGRVYNGANRPPAPAIGADTISTLKSFSSPGGATFNEFLFDDAAGGEQIRLHAGKDWHSKVNNDRTEQIDNCSTSKVNVDRSEHTGANRFAVVVANNSEQVLANHSLMVAANRTITTGLNLTQTVGIDKTESVGSNRKLEIGASETRSIGVSRSVTVGVNQTHNIGAMCIKTVGADEKKTIGGNKITVISNNYNTTINQSQTTNIAINKITNVSANFNLTVDGKIEEKTPEKEETIFGMKKETKGSHWDQTNGVVFDVCLGMRNILTGGSIIDVCAPVRIGVTAGLHLETGPCVMREYGIKTGESALTMEEAATMIDEAALETLVAALVLLG